MTLLARYLPPVPEKMAAGWVESRTLKGKIVLDPFAASPRWSAAAARAGARLVVAVNNPIARLLVEIAAAPPTPEETLGALAALASARVREERLEPHLRDLYTTRCPQCQRQIQAQAFIWARDAAAPSARLLHCPHCDTRGEFPVEEADCQQAARFTAGGPHHARALERVAPLNDPDRQHAEEALNVYPPRAVYALLTIVNKLESLELPPRLGRILDAMLLHTFDRGNTLWPYPAARERPRQLTVPPRYRENNLWLALEKAAALLAQAAGAPAAPITRWPELPPKDGGLCLFDGRIKALAEHIGELSPEAVLTVFPRPNQAFWSLSALWAGWLWGHGAVEGFKSVLRRRRYDWGWHTTALQAALESIRPALETGVPLLGLIGEAETGFITAAVLAAGQAGFALEDFSLDEEAQLARICWTATATSAAGKAQHAQNPTDARFKNDSKAAIRDALRAHLLARGEPCGALPLQIVALSALARHGLLPDGNTPSKGYAQTRQVIREALTYRNGFLRFGGREKSSETGLWWLADDKAAATPLADRVEVAVVRYLLRNPGCTLEAIEAALEAEFNGLMSPPRALVAACLQSYGEYTGAGWRLREGDSPTKRRAELVSMGGMLVELGEKLRFRVHPPENETQPVLWQDAFESPQYAFFVSASALLGKFLLRQNPAPARGMLVIPGGRANLVMFKLRRDPRLQKVAEAWGFVKYRQLRRMREHDWLTPENFEAQLALDPLTYEDEQLRLL